MPHHTEYHRDGRKGIQSYNYDDEGNRTTRFCENCGRRIKKRGFAKVCRYCDPVERLGYSNIKAQREGSYQMWRDKVVP